MESDDLKKTLDYFLIIAAHELRKPLTTTMSIAASLEIRRRLKLSDEELDKFLRRIREIAEQALSNMNKYLEFSKVLAGLSEIQVKKTNFYKEILRPTIEHYEENLIGKGIIATWDMPKNLELMCDSGLIRMVYDNLLDNVVKYAQEETRLVLAYEKKEQHCFSTISCARHIEDREGIFRPFYTGKVGFGLSFCKSIIEAHKGKMWAEPAYFDGKNFYSAEKQGVLTHTLETELMQANNFVFTLPKN